jgi:hypothetical protein
MTTKSHILLSRYESGSSEYCHNHCKPISAVILALAITILFPKSILVGTAYADQPSPKPITASEGTERKTADGEKYPNAEGRKVDLKLPFVGRLLGGLPEEVSKTPIYSLKSNERVVQKWKRLLEQNQVNYSDYDYVTSGLYGAEATLIDVENGRVKALGYLFPHLTPMRVVELLNPIGKTSQKAEKTGNGFIATFHDIKFIGSLSGSHAWLEEGPPPPPHAFHPGLDFNPQSASMAKHSYFSFISLSVAPIDWYVAHNHLEPQIVKAMLAGHLARGMKTTEAEMVFGKATNESIDSDGRTVLQWSAGSAYHGVIITTAFVNDRLVYLHGTSYGE